MALPTNPSGLAAAISSRLEPDDAPPPERSNRSGLSIAWQDDSGATQSVRFDVVSTETHEAIMSITDHPVERGANVADHAREQPRSITIEGFVSNSPLPSNPGMDGLLTLQPVDLTLPKKSIRPNVNSLVAAGISAISDAITPSDNGALVYSLAGTKVNRARLMHEILTTVREQARLVTLVSTFAYADSMLITRVGAVRALSDGTGATFHVELRRIRLVSAVTVDAPKPTEARGMIAAASGSKATKEAGDDQKKKGSSLLVKGLKKLGVLGS